MSQEHTIRRATREDIPEILALVKELADFEKAPERVEATESKLLETLAFTASAAGPEKTGYAQTFILTVEDKVAAFALYFHNYSTWLATPGIYLEDLFVRPAYRRRGFATTLIKRLAQETSKVSGGRGRLEWSCLRWNEGALQFYDKLGGERMVEWVGIRVEGERLKKLAAN